MWPGYPLRGDDPVTGVPTPRGCPHHQGTRSESMSPSPVSPSKELSLGPAHPPGTAAPAWHGRPCGSKSPLCRGARERKRAPDKGHLFVCRRGDPAPGSVPAATSQAGPGVRVPPSLAWDADSPALPPQIYPDPELEAQVLSLTIRCIHSEEGCRWTGLIKHLQVGSGRMWGLRLHPLDTPSPSLHPPGPSWHLRLQRHPLPQPLQRQAEPPGPARARPAQLPQAPGQVRVLRQRLHRGGLRGGQWGGGNRAGGMAVVGTLWGTQLAGVSWGTWRHHWDIARLGECNLGCSVAMRGSRWGAGNHGGHNPAMGTEPGWKRPCRRNQPVGTEPG